MVQMTAQEIGMSKRISGYQELREKIVDTVRSIDGRPKRWLDTGCGAGGSVRMSLESFPDTEFVLADPTEKLLSEARSNIGDRVKEYVLSSTDSLDLPDGSFDVITAILSHHYYPDRDSKMRALGNCHRMLCDGGLYLMVEHTVYEDQVPKDAEWRSYMEEHGLPEESIQEMFDRRNKVYYPYGESDHMEMLESVGFRDAKVFWRSCSDIGIVTRKRDGHSDLFIPSNESASHDNSNP